MSKIITVAKDTNKKGLSLKDLLIELDIVDSETANSLIRKGTFSINNTLIKDVKFIIPTGMSMIFKSDTPIIKVTVL